MTERPPIYADENVRYRLVEALRTRGFDVVTAGDAGLLGRDDNTQLAHAASVGRVLLTFDRRDFRRVHASFRKLGHAHAGLALLPQHGGLDRLIARAAILLDWLGSHAEELGPSFLVNWNDVQLQLHRGERLPGYDEGDVQRALGLTPRAR